MNSFETIILLFVFLGWFGDAISTVIPNKDLPEKNPFIVKRFGEHPGSKVLIIKILAAIAPIIIHLAFRPFFTSNHILFLLPIYIIFGTYGWYLALNNFVLLYKMR
jgi:hypothetical protein